MARLMQCARGLWRGPALDLMPDWTTRKSALIRPNNHNGKLGNCGDNLGIKLAERLLTNGLFASIHGLCRAQPTAVLLPSY